MTAFSVVIVSYRTPELTVAAVQSAMAADPAAEVVVVDNASTDQSVSALRALGNGRPRVLINESNMGYGAAANRGAEASRGATLFFLNSDAVLSADALTLLAAEVARYGGRCIAAARLVGADGATQRSAGLLPGPVDLTIRALGLNRLGDRIATWPGLGALVGRTSLAREYWSAPAAKASMDTSMVSGACCAMGRIAFDELGGFDERFFLYFEDADLCRRAAGSGMAIRYVPAAVVPHIGGASSPEDYHFGPYHARSMRQYLAKWYGPSGSTLALLLLWLRAVGLTVALQPQATRAWRALWAALRDEDPRR